MTENRTAAEGGRGMTIDQIQWGTGRFGLTMSQVLVQLVIKFASKVLVLVVPFLVDITVYLTSSVASSR